MAHKTKKSPTPSTAKKTGAELPMDTPKGSGASLLAHDLLAPVQNLHLDGHQLEMVAFLRSRLGGSTSDVVEFLATVSLFAMGLDEAASSRVDDGVKRIFAGAELGTAIMNSLAETDCEARNRGIVMFLRNLTRPRMAGDWRGEPLPKEPEAAPAEA